MDLTPNFMSYYVQNSVMKRFVEYEHYKFPYTQLLGRTYEVGFSEISS